MGRDQKGRNRQIGAPDDWAANEAERLLWEAWNDLTGADIPDWENTSAGTIGIDGIRLGGLRTVYWLSDNTEILYSRIRVAWKYDEKKRLLKGSTLIAALADMLCAVFGFIPGFTVSTLLAHQVLDKLSDNPHPNRFFISKLLALVARRDSGGARRDSPYLHHAVVGQVHYEIGQYDKARERFEMALACAEGPDQQADAVNNLAYYALIPLGHFKEAIELIQDIVPHSRTDHHKIARLDTLGQAYTGARDLDHALSILREAISMDTPARLGDDSQLIRIHAAEAFALSGNLSAAQQLCAEVLQLPGHALKSYRAQELVEKLLTFSTFMVPARIDSTHDLSASEFITSRNSRIFHRISCPMVGLIDAKNRFVLASPEDAGNKGLRACKYCKP